MQGNWTGGTLIKMKKKIFLIYEEIQKVAVAKSYMTNTASSYMTKNFCISSYIRMPFLIYDRSHLNFIIYEENFLFFFNSVRSSNKNSLACGG
jgi:hypothetical protein